MCSEGIFILKTHINSEDPDEMPLSVAFHQDLQYLLRIWTGFHNLNIQTCDPLKHNVDDPWDRILLTVMFPCINTTIRMLLVHGFDNLNTPVLGH